MLILGIDPGSRYAGWGLLRLEKKKMHYVSSGVISPKGHLSFFERLSVLKQELEVIINQYNPDEISLEGLIYVKSPTSSIKLSQSRGVLISTLLPKYEKKIFEYAPNTVKSVTTGHGHATKESVQKMLHLLLGVSEFQTEDESDALAIALCHCLERENETNLSNLNKKSKGRSLKNSLSHKFN